MDKLQWWREARFGLFIHWGLYCVPAGKYQGKDVPGIGEWIMNRMKIPVSEYALYANDFTAENYNADEWVRIAKDAGMKYICITSKHHDGFAMFDSKCDDYNIVKRTPFGRDPMKELAEACHRHGLMLCFYYSQAQDWAHPNGIGNDWDFGPEQDKDFDQYMYQKVLPQLTELLTGYGRIGLIWFDTPKTITERQSRIIAEHVHKLQPDCLVSGRIGHGVCDYKSSGDNMIPLLPTDQDWECPATINDTWGYKTEDHNWKSPRDIIRLMVDIVGKNGNYLLNVGPDKHGTIPQASQEILHSVGEWMRTNGESIYGTTAAPALTYETPNIKLTHKPGKLFIHILGEVKVYGMEKAIMLSHLNINISRAYFLSDPQTELKAVCTYDQASATHRTRISVGAAPESDIDTVICVEYKGDIVVEPF